MRQIVKVSSMKNSQGLFLVEDKNGIHRVHQEIPMSVFSKMKRDKVEQAFYSAQWDGILDVWNIQSPSTRNW